VDPHKRKTLDLIVSLLGKTTASEANRQLLLVAHDFVLAHDLRKSKETLEMIKLEYWESEDHLKHLEEDRLVAKAMADLMDVFGIDLTLLTVKGFLA